uniref:E1A protein n=1 Tax=Rhinolophus ferrumequinum adenovirus TaxID=3140013 RepID=A0AAU6S565_9ADEN
MKTITLELDPSLLAVADSLLNQVEDGGLFEPDFFSTEGLHEVLESPSPSLHELFDVTVPDGFQDYSREVELIFPSSAIDHAENETEVRCNTPVVEIDLACNESMLSSTPSVSEVDAEESSSEEPDSDVCRDCTRHREESGEPGIKCALCYMKDTYYQVYSK